MDESFGAGGFDNSIAGGSGVQSETNKSPGIVPLFIKQILNSPLPTQTEFNVWGIKVSNVKCVALVRSVEHESTKISYTIEDHTGSIEAHFWLEENDAADTPPIVINTYNRIFGSIRMKGSTDKAIMIFKIEPIRNVNEVTTHMLEVLNLRYKAEKYAKQSVSMPTFNQTTDSRKMGNNPLGLTPKQLKVFDIVRSVSPESRGINVKDIRHKMPQLSESALKEIIQFLTSEGHIFTTVDSEHYLSSETV